MNTMYAQVSARTREIGTLRAIGFSRRSILALLRPRGADAVPGAAESSACLFTLLVFSTFPDEADRHHELPDLLGGPVQLPHDAAARSPEASSSRSPWASSAASSRRARRAPEDHQRPPRDLTAAERTLRRCHPLGCARARGRKDSLTDRSLTPDPARLAEGAFVRATAALILGAALRCSARAFVVVAEGALPPRDRALSTWRAGN